MTATRQAMRRIFDHAWLSRMAAAVFTLALLANSSHGGGASEAAKSLLKQLDSVGA